MTATALPDMLVSDLLARWPQATVAFNHLKMACPGCAMAPFMTVSEACASYGLPVDRVVETIAREIGGAAAPDGGTME